MKLHESTRIIDSSKLSDYMDCPRKWLFRHGLGWVTDVPNHNLDFGSFLHISLDALYSYGFNDASLELAKATFFEAYREKYAEETDDIYFPKSPYAAMELLDLYYKRMLPTMDEYECLHTEISGSVPLLNGSRLALRVDQLARHKTTNMKFIREYKSTTRNDRQWRDQWLLSTQIGCYTHLLYSLYDINEVEGVIVEQLLFQKKGVDVNILPCRKTPEQMLSWLNSTSKWHQKLKEDILFLESAPEDYLLENDVLECFPLNSQSCTKYFGCEYHPYCCAWANPMKHCEEPPIGFRQEFWDPNERPAKKEINV